MTDAVWEAVRLVAGAARDSFAIIGLAFAILHRKKTLAWMWEHRDR